MSLFLFSNLLVSITSLGLILLLLIYGRQKIHRIWALCNFVVFTWGVGTLIISSTANPLLIYIGWQLALIGGYFIATTYYHTIYVLTASKNKAFLILTYLFTSLAAIFTLFNKVVPQFRLMFNSIYFPRATVAYLIIYLGWALIATVASAELLKFMKSTTPVKRLQSKYMLTAFIIGFIGGGSALWPSWGVSIYPFGNIGVALYAIIGTYAILRYRLMDIKAAITRTGIFTIVYAFVLGMPFWLGFKLLGKGLWILPLSFSVVLATSGPFIYRLLQKKAEDILLVEQRRYQKLLLQAASGMVDEHNLDKLAKLIVYIVKRSVKINFAAIFIDDKQNGVYRLKATRDSGEVSYKDATFLYEYPFIEYLKNHKDPVLYEELPLDMKRNLGTLSGISLIIPSVVQDNLLGFVLLGEKLNRRPYTEDDINVFKTLSNQAALAISYCLFLEEFKKAQERIFTADKLGLIGGMADGVAHQVKNRLNQFSVAAGELKYAAKDFIKKYAQLIEKNPDMEKEIGYFLQTADSIVSNVKKTDGVVRGLLGFARVEEKEQFFSKFNLKELIDYAVDMLKVKHEISQFSLGIGLEGGDDFIYGVKPQVLEAIYNLIDNAYEACLEKRDFRLNEQEKEAYHFQIRLNLTQADDYSLIALSDNGVGVKDEDKKKIFAPFFTTKSSYKSGTGIGIYVVKRIIEESHQGQISFSSEYLQGTTFYIKLPKKGRKI